MNLTKLITSAGKFIKINAPTILSFLGSACVAGTAVTATVMSKKIENKKYEIYGDKTKDTSEKAKAVIKEVGPLYLPTLGMIAGALACIWGANGINLARQSTLSSGVLASTMILNEYRNKIREEKGSEEEQKLYSEVIESLPNSPSEKITIFDPLLQYEFETTWFNFIQATTELNRTLHHNCIQARVYDFYMNIPEISIENMPERSKYYGWNYDMFLDDPAIWVDYKLMTIDQAKKSAWIDCDLIPIVSDKERFYVLSWWKGPCNLENGTGDILDSLYPYEE